MNRAAHNAYTKRMCPDIPMELIDGVNAALDAPSKQLGPSHRSLYHDPVSAGLLGAQVAVKMGYPASMGMRAAYAHLLEDKFTDKLVPIKLPLGLTAKKVFDAING